MQVTGITYPVKKSEKKPFSVRLSVWSARHRWLVFGLWFLLVFGLVFGSNLIPASKTANDPNAGLDFESSKAYSILKDGGGQAEPAENFYLIITHPTLKPADAAFRTTVEKLIVGLKELNYTEDGQTRPLFAQLVSPYEAPATAGLISPDGTTARIYGRILGETYTEKMNKRLEPFGAKIDDLKKGFSEYTALVNNTTLNYLEEGKAVQEGLNQSLLTTLIPTFIILLCVFGALVAAFIPLLLAITAIIGTTGVVVIYSRLSGDTQINNAMTLAVLMGLAVAVDYSLFVISRYRNERYAGREKIKALEIASGTAGRAVFFSGILVAISISGLFLLGGPLGPMALSIITVVLMSVLGSMTFLPATLSILGRGVNWGRIPYFGREHTDGQGFWSMIVRGVMRRPIITTVVATTLLVAMAFPVLHIRLGFSETTSDKLQGGKAAKVLNEKWPQGAQLQLQVVITEAGRPQTLAAIEKFKAAALAVPGVNGPVETLNSADGKVQMLSFYQAGSWNDQANQDTVRKLRQETAPAYFKGLEGTQVYVTGWSAMVVDQSKFFTNPIVWVFVLSLSFLVLLLVFRSLVIATKAILLNLLSTGAAYGAVTLVFQDGRAWVKPTGVMEAWLPVFIFTIIFGLSMDYHMFILTRIKELRDHGYSSNEAVAKGISSTSGTITGAAAIMVVVFGDFFISLDTPAIQQLGLGLAVAVFLDATIVRSMLLPAVMRLMGDFNWWMPRFLNWLPTITIESGVEDETTPDATLSEADEKLLMQVSGR